MKRTKLIRTGLIVLASAAALWLGTVFLLPVILPFVIALGTAKLAQPLVRFLQERAGLPRWLASGAVVLGLFTLLGLGIFWLTRGIFSELARFTQALPELLASLAGPMERLRQRLEELTARAPDFLSASLDKGIDSLFENGPMLAEKGSAALFSLVTGIITALPDIFLFVVTTILATFMICGQYDALWAWAARQLPENWRKKAHTVAESLRTTLVAWLKAQLKLIGVTFLVLTLGLMLLNVDYPFLFGGLIALIDALPVFGTGTVLIPWSLLRFLRGDARRGVGLLLLYGGTYLTRTVLEPRLVGKQMGLHPLLTLLALYAGYHLLGVAGMILFPIAALLIKQLWDHSPRLEH